MLCTIADINARISSDITDVYGYVAELIASAGRAIARETHATYEPGNVAETLEVSTRRRIVWTGRYPVAAVNSLTLDGTALVEGDDFSIDGEGAITRNGLLKLWTPAVGGTPGLVAVDYDYGYSDVADVPPGLRDLACDIVLARFNYSQAWAADPNISGRVRSESIGDYSIAYDNPDGETREVVALTPAERRDARKYRRSMSDDLVLW